MRRSSGIRWLRDPVPEAVHWAIEEIEAGLEDIDFPEVTWEDRVTFLETAAAWQASKALKSGRGYVLFPLRAFVERRRVEMLRAAGLEGAGRADRG